jgi:hypothetical protein
MTIYSKYLEPYDFHLPTATGAAKTAEANNNAATPLLVDVYQV